MIRKVDVTTSIITTVAGGGFSNLDGAPATQASLLNPGGIALDPEGNLFIADGGINSKNNVFNNA